MKLRFFSTALLIIALCTAAFSQSLDTAKLDKFLDTLAQKNKAMGSLAIAKDGKILYTRAIGYSQINGTEKTPSAVTTKYRIGSITKMFTAVMVMQLVEEGKLKLTDTLDKFFIRRFRTLRKSPSNRCSVIEAAFTVLPATRIFRRG